MKLSILIPSLESRSQSLNNLLMVLDNQKKRLSISDTEVEILTFIDSGENTIGFKRNKLIERATGEYVCFIDDDDDISFYYLEELLRGIDKQVDCCSLKGVITWDGGSAEIFEHSKKYEAYVTTTNPIKYERYPNHLNCIKSEIAKQFKFPEINHGEDTDWATQINNSGLIKDEYYIDKVIYHYNYKTNK